jgi:hypothetical protein
MPEGIGQREVLIGVGILLVIAVITVPLLGYSQKKNRRAECEQVVASIRAAQLKQHKDFPGEGYLSSDWAPRDPTRLDADAIEWTPSAGFKALGWSPAQLDLEWLRGTYRIAAKRDSFKVMGWCDIDGDGIPAKFEADQETTVHAVTASDIY